MSINTTPPVSLKDIQDNFYKSGAVGSVDRYVIDFAQRDGVTWDLLDYAGQAYGLQYKIFQDGWNGGDSAGDLPLDETDKRIDGAHDRRDKIPGGTYAILGEDEKGKYAELGLHQTFGRDGPGAVAMNGIFYADQTGQYRMRATVETLDGFSDIGEPGIFVFGYRYGYLDGDRRAYSLWGQGSRPGPNQTIACDVTFTVQDNYRHVVVNPNCFMEGRWDSDRAAFKIRDLTIEKV
jgi:hypothetical protein